ncbi:MAG: hybrid sensor histidine kinase/response regulator [Thermodesulfobacteriota bacterium]
MTSPTPATIQNNPIEWFSRILLEVIESLRETEAKYRTILDNIVEGYYEVDIAGNLLFFNNSMCAMLGYTREEMTGMNNRRFMDDENARKVYHAFNEVFTTGNSYQGLDWVLIRKDGTKCYIETSVSLIRNAKNEGIGFRGLARDITARKRAEEEREQIEKQLQHALRMESIGTLAGGIAHNFNNLLMAIQGYTTIMLLQTEPSDKRHRMLQSIEKQVEAGSRLTGQLLGYAREGKYEIKPLNLNHLVRETAETFAVTRKEIRVHQVLEAELRGIIADRSQLEQVLMNLLVNAADAMPAGGNLVLKTENKTHLDIRVDDLVPKEGSYVCLTVQDTGIGMDAKTLDHIFEPFFTTKDISRGSGLGLASAYGIVKAHGGYIHVHSRKGEGTIFSVYLPAVRKSVESAEDQPEAAVRGEGTVLFVDDDDTVRSLGNELLNLLGYKTVLASGGREAVDVYRRRGAEIDLVILDMIMPDMGGGAVYDLLKSINPRVKVLLSSGYSIDGQATDILSRGCNGFIQKPFSLNEVSLKIRRILHAG